MAPLVCHPADSLTAEAGPVRRGPLRTRTPEELPVWHAARGTWRGAGGYLSVYSLKPRAHRRSQKNLKLLNTRLAQVPNTVEAGGARHHQLFEERGRTSRTDWWWWCLGEGGEMEPFPKLCCSSSEPVRPAAAWNALLATPGETNSGKVESTRWEGSDAGRHHSIWDV